MNSGIKPSASKNGLSKSEGLCMLRMRDPGAPAFGGTLGIECLTAFGGS